MPIKTYKYMICGRTTNSSTHLDKDNTSRTKCTSPSGKQNEPPPRKKNPLSTNREGSRYYERNKRFNCFFSSSRRGGCYGVQLIPFEIPGGLAKNYRVF